MVPLVETRRVLSLLYRLNAEAPFSARFTLFEKGCKGRTATRPLLDPAEGWIATLLGNDVAMSHAVLLGDSIFDNAAYVAGTSDVVRQVRRRLPQGFANPSKSP
jgi:hypothetical protein